MQCWVRALYHLIEVDNVDCESNCFQKYMMLEQCQMLREHGEALYEFLHKDEEEVAGACDK